MGYEVFSPDQLRHNAVRLQHQVPGKVPEGIGGFGADIEVRFRKVPVQIPRKNCQAVGDSAPVYF